MLRSPSLLYFLQLIYVIHEVSQRLSTDGLLAHSAMTCFILVTVLVASLRLLRSGFHHVISSFRRRLQQRKWHEWILRRLDDLDEGESEGDGNVKDSIAEGSASPTVLDIMLSKLRDAVFRNKQRRLSGYAQVLLAHWLIYAGLFPFLAQDRCIATVNATTELNSEDYASTTSITSDQCVYYGYVPTIIQSQNKASFHIDIIMHVVLWLSLLLSTKVYYEYSLLQYKSINFVTLATSIIINAMEALPSSSSRVSFPSSVTDPSLDSTQRLFVIPVDSQYKSQCIVFESMGLLLDVDTRWYCLLRRGVFIEAIGEQFYDDNSSVASCMFNEEEGDAEVNQLSLDLRQMEVALLEYSTSHSTEKNAKNVLATRASTLLVSPIQRVFIFYLMNLILNVMALSTISLPLMCSILEYFQIHMSMHISSFIGRSILDIQRCCYILSFSSLAIGAMINLLYFWSDI